MSNTPTADGPNRRSNHTGAAGRGEEKRLGAGPGGVGCIAHMADALMGKDDTKGGGASPTSPRPLSFPRRCNTPNPAPLLRVGTSVGGRGGRKNAHAAQSPGDRPNAPPLGARRKAGSPSAVLLDGTTLIHTAAGTAACPPAARRCSAAQQQGARTRAQMKRIYSCPQWGSADPLAGLPRPHGQAASAADPLLNHGHAPPSLATPPPGGAVAGSPLGVCMGEGAAGGRHGDDVRG